MAKRTRNKFEASIERQLKKAKVKFSYETERIPYVIASHYIPDFIISTPLGRIYIETKGYLRPEHKRKMVAVKRQHPSLDIRIVFQRRTRENARWAERHGFKHSFEKIPKEWLDGL